MLIHVKDILFMFNYFQCNIIMYDKYFSKGHKCRDNFCPPLFSPMVGFNITAYGGNLKTEQSVPIDTILKANIIIMVFSLYSDSKEKVCLYIMNM